MQLDLAGFGLRNIQFGFIWLTLFVIAGTVIGVYLDSNEKYAETASGPPGSLGSIREHIRSAHAHSGLFALINIFYGLLIDVTTLSPSVKNVGSWLIIAGAVILPLSLFGKAFLPKNPVFNALVGISSIVIIIAIAIICYGYIII
jgi:hypothetical protein